VRGARQPFDVHDLDSRIGWRFEIKNLATLRHRGFDLCEIRRIAQAHIDPKRGEKLGEQLVGAPITVLDGYNAIAGSKERKQTGTDGGHARREAGCCLRALQSFSLVLEGSHGWVGVARIDVPLFASKGNCVPADNVFVTE
jgi:hypothetical protein